MEDGRVERGRQIAASRRLRQAPDGSWLVLSQSLPKKKYIVVPGKTCTCPDFQEWEIDCKHIYAVRFAGHPIEVTTNGIPEVMPPRQQYPQNWAAYNQAQIVEKDLFQKLLHDLCSGIPQPVQTKGRPRLPLSDAVFASVMKVYVTVSGRRASTDIRECQAKGHLHRAPHHNSISNYLSQPGLTPILTKLIEESAAPLKALETQFAIDSTGFGTITYTRWFDHKYGQPSKKQRWLKAHAMVGTSTNVVTSVEVTDGYVSDTNQLPDLVAHTAKNFNVKEVSADKAYLSNLNLMSVTAHGAEPFIPFKSNSQGTGTSAWQKLWHLFWFRRDEFLKHYHRRSNVESTFSAIKRKFGGSLRSKGLTAQTNEVLCKILAFNLTVLIHEMHELGITPDFGNGAITVNAIGGAT